MIYTITLNPAIDYFLNLSKPLSHEKINRADSVNMRAAGKGINVSKVLDVLGIPSRAVVLLGGFTGHFIAEEISTRKNIEVISVSVEEATRVNVKLNCEEGTHYAINAKGPCADEDVKRRLLEALKGLKENDCVMLCGSNVPGIDDAWFIELADLVNSRNANLVMDTESLSFDLVKKCKPYLIKPNLFEFGLLLDTHFEDAKDIDRALDKVIDLGAENILLTLDKDGAILANKHHRYHLRQSVVHTVNEVGNGDTMLGTFVGKKITGSSDDEALRWGGAAGSANASTLSEVTEQLIVGEMGHVEVEIVK